MSMQQKKEFAIVDYTTCNPHECDPKEGICPATEACSHNVIKQLDGLFESPMIFQDMCMGCWDCIDACPLDAVGIKHVT